MGKIIEVKNVSVKYITGDLRNIGLKEFVMKKLTHQYRAEEFLAVNDVSFSLENGDMLGIIGTNGAGKSTLLNTLTQAGVLAEDKLFATLDPVSYTHLTLPTIA